MLKNKDMLPLLEMWGRLEYIEADAYGMNAFTFVSFKCHVITIDLLVEMLCIDENERISIEQIMAHEWIRSSTNPRGRRISSRLRRWRRRRRILQRMFKQTPLEMMKSQTSEVSDAAIFADVDE